MANECGACGLDFGSLAAFDAHRVGRHEYTCSEGLAMDPPREDGRRCLYEWEIAEAVDRAGSFIFARNGRGAWSLRSGLDSVRAAFSDELSTSQGHQDEAA